MLRRVSANSKNWKGLRSRLIGPWPKRDPLNRKSIWIHAVSLGESKAIMPMIQKIQSERPQTRIICTVQSDTAYDFFSKVPGVEVYYTPLDISWVQKAFVARINPELLILSEGDLWYHQLKFARKVGAKIVLLSAKLSEQTMQVYKKFPWIADKFLQIDAIGAQNQIHYERFAEVLKDTSILSISGNLKYAQQPHFSFEESAFKKLLGLTKTDYPITIASTHECEEEGILNAIREILEKDSHPKFFIAPRHPSRFLPFYERLKKQFNHVDLFSDLQSGSLHAGESRICLVNQMGILSDFFRISKIAILAGSFDPSIGGHNLLEPLQAGCPVLFGPHTQTQTEFAQLILGNQAGWQLSLAEIPEFIHKIQRDSIEYAKVFNNGLSITSEYAQTKNKSWQLIQENFAPKRRLKIL